MKIILPNQEEDAAAYAIASKLISGDVEGAVDAAIESEKWADALSIASCGSDELFRRTRAKYLGSQNTPLSSLVRNIVNGKLQNIVEQTDIENWKQIFAVICNFAKHDFEKLCNNLGRRLIAIQDNYDDAFVCFIAGRDFPMIRQCLFKISELNDSQSSNGLPTLLSFSNKYVSWQALLQMNPFLPLLFHFFNI